MNVQVTLVSLLYAGSSFMIDVEDNERLRFNIRYNNFIQVFRFRAYIDRPYATNAWAGDYDFRYLKDEIHNWMVEHKIIYKIKFINSNQDTQDYISWVLEFNNKEDAVLFKLIWC